MSVIIEVTDNADNEDGRRLQRSTDGGSTWTTVDTVGSDVTTLEDTNPPLYEFVQYRTETYTEHVVSHSTTVTTLAVEENDFYVTLESGSDSVILVPSDIKSIEVNPEHTAIWGASINVSPSAQSALDYALYDAEIFYQETRFFEGSVKVVSYDTERTELRCYGKIEKLEEDTRFVRYPDAITSNTGIPVHEAIADYWSRLSVTETVNDYSARTVRTDELYYDTTNFSDFANITNIPDNVPATVINDEIVCEQTCWFEEAEDATQFGTIIDTADAPSDHSMGQAVELNSAGEYVELSFTPQYDFPSSDFLPRIRYETENWDGWLMISLDGSDIDLTDAVGTGGSQTQAAQWAGDLDLDSGVTVNSIPDFTAGQTYTLTVEARANSNGDFAGRVIVDVLAPRDTGGRFGTWTYNEDNSPDTGSQLEISGPEKYPEFVDVEISAEEIWNVAGVELQTTFNDTTYNQSVAATNDGTNYIENSNSETLTADFTANNYYGSVATARLRLSRYDGGSSVVSPTNGDAGQKVTDFIMYVDTNDLPIIEPDTPVVLENGTDLENVQTLHEEGDFRFIVDHDQDGIVVESFRRGDDSVVKSADWTVEMDGVEKERDTLDYANRIKGVADGTTSTIEMTSEVTENGEEQISLAFPDVTSNDELNRKLRREAIKRSNDDVISGTLVISPKLVLPGYPYNVPEYDGEQANLNAVRFDLSGSNSRGQLKFGKRRTITARLPENS